MDILLTPPPALDHTIDVALLRGEVAWVYDQLAKELAEHRALGRAVQSLLSQLAVHDTAHVFVDEFADAYARERQLLPQSVL